MFRSIFIYFFHFLNFVVFFYKKIKGDQKINNLKKKNLKKKKKNDEKRIIIFDNIKIDLNKLLIIKNDTKYRINSTEKIILEKKKTSFFDNLEKLKNKTLGNNTDKKDQVGNISTKKLLEDVSNPTNNPQQKSISSRPSKTAIEDKTNFSRKAPLKNKPAIPWLKPAFARGNKNSLLPPAALPRPPGS